MTYYVSGGTLNLTHSPLWLLLLAGILIHNKLRPSFRSTAQLIWPSICTGWRVQSGLSSSWTSWSAEAYTDGSVVPRWRISLRDVAACRHLCATSSSSLVVRRTCLLTFGDRAVPVAAYFPWAVEHHCGMSCSWHRRWLNISGKGLLRLISSFVPSPNLPPSVDAVTVI